MIVVFKTILERNLTSRFFPAGSAVLSQYYTVNVMATRSSLIYTEKLENLSLRKKPENIFDDFTEIKINLQNGPKLSKRTIAKFANSPVKKECSCYIQKAVT